jgi:hypothetical protein
MVGLFFLPFFFLSTFVRVTDIGGGTAFGFKMNSENARDSNCRLCRRHNGRRMYKLTPDKGGVRKGQNLVASISVDERETTPNETYLRASKLLQTA